MDLELRRHGQAAGRRGRRRKDGQDRGQLTAHWFGWLASGERMCAALPLAPTCPCLTFGLCASLSFSLRHSLLLLLVCFADLCGDSIHPSFPHPQGKNKSNCIFGEELSAQTLLLTTSSVFRMHNIISSFFSLSCETVAGSSNMAFL